MPFVRLCLDLTGEVFSGVRPWFAILTEKSVELWSDSFQWLLSGRRGGDAAWFDGDCRRAFELKQSAYHRWCRNRSAENWDLFCQARGTANRLYAAAKARYSADCRRNLDDCASANAWWRTLKGHVFGAESDIPPLCSPGGALVSDPAGKAELLSTWFDSKQSRDIVELPQTCHPRPAFCGIAFRAREVERYLLDLDPNGGVDPSGCFPMFFQKTASVLAPKLSLSLFVDCCVVVSFRSSGGLLM